MLNLLGVCRQRQLRAQRHHGDVNPEDPLLPGFDEHALLVDHRVRGLRDRRDSVAASWDVLGVERVGSATADASDQATGASSAMRMASIRAQRRCVEIAADEHELVEPRVGRLPRTAWAAVERHVHPVEDEAAVLAGDVENALQCAGGRGRVAATSLLSQRLTSRRPGAASSGSRRSRCRSSCSCSCSSSSAGIERRADS